jgi:hypothetical protein
MVYVITNPFGSKCIVQTTNSNEPMGVHGQTTNAMLFQMQAMWLKDIKEFL